MLLSEGEVEAYRNRLPPTPRLGEHGSLMRPQRVQHRGIPPPDTQVCRSVFAPYTAQKFERKWESRYRGELPFDRNSDGVPKPEKTFYSDLMLRHFRSEGTIWICTRDLMPKQNNLRLKVFFDNYVSSLVSNERMLCGDVFGYQTQKPIFSARVLEHKRTELTPYTALEATMVLDDPRIHTPNPVEGVDNSPACDEPLEERHHDPFTYSRI